MGIYMKTYLRHRSLNVIDIKEIIALEYLDFEGKYRDYTENHDFCELCFVEKGKITIQLKNEKQELSRGDLVFIEPNTRHTYFSEIGNQSRVFVMCFECPGSTLRMLSGKRFMAEEDEIYCIRKIIGESQNTYRMNENDLLEVLTSPSFGGQQAVILQLEYLLISLLRRLFSENSSEIVFLSKEKFYKDLVDIITDYLRSNVNQKIRLSDICKRFNYSRSFICKIFKEQTGESLITYFNRLKVEEAKRLLCESDMSAASISEHLGFSEAKYFGVIFKNQVGTSPAAYREKIRKENKEKGITE